MKFETDPETDAAAAVLGIDLKEELTSCCRNVKTRAAEYRKKQLSDRLATMTPEQQEKLFAAAKK